MCRKCDSYQGHHQIMNLLDLLIKDEKKINRKLYSSGPYWNYKNLKSIIEIKKKGISNFRGFANSSGTSFTDNLHYDVRNELGYKGRIIGKILSFPIINRIFNHQLILTKNYLDAYLKALSIIYSKNQNVEKLIKKYQFNKTTEFDCIKKFNFQNKEYSVLYLEIADRVEKLSTKFNFSNISSFFEIGGGFGANIHFLITNFPNIKKVVYLDIVPNIYLGSEYLKYFFGSNVKDYSYTKKLDKISFKDNNELEIICIPPWEIEKLNVKIDHFHNAASFVEMPKYVIENYCKFIKKFEIQDISLISYDGYDNKTTFKPELLNEFFDNKLEINWHSWLIEDFKRKLIYLSSK